MVKTKEQKKIPFDVKEFRDMIGKEFFLMTFTPEKLRRKDEKDELSKRLKERVKDGLIAEVISREAHNIKFYNLGTIASAVYEDEKTKLSECAKDAHATYIFTLESVRLPKGKPPILKGMAREYGLHCNTTGLGHKVILAMSEIPTYKQKSGLMCL